MAECCHFIAMPATTWLLTIAPLGTGSHRPSKQDRTELRVQCRKLDPSFRRLLQYWIQLSKAAALDSAKQVVISASIPPAAARLCIVRPSMCTLAPAG